MSSTGCEVTWSSWSAVLSSGFCSKTTVSSDDEESPTEAMSEGTTPCCWKPVTNQCCSAASTLQVDEGVSGTQTHHLAGIRPAAFRGLGDGGQVLGLGGWGSPEGLSSRSLTDFGAEVNHLDFEDFWDIWMLSDRH